MPFHESIPSRTGAFPLGSEEVEGRRQTVFGVLYEDRYDRDGALFFLMTGHRGLMKDLVGHVPNEEGQRKGANGVQTRVLRNDRVGTHGRSQGFYRGKGIGSRPFRH